MFYNFSPAATFIEDFFKKIYLKKTQQKVGLLEKLLVKPINPQEILLFQKEIERNITFYFRNMNSIVKSSLSKKEKENLLEITRLYACHYITQDDSYYYFEEDLWFKAEMLDKIYSYILSVIDTKYKRSLFIVQNGK
jgi:hypothetical protein